MGNLCWVLGVTRTASPGQCHQDNLTRTGSPGQGHQDSVLLRQDPQTERRQGNASSWLGCKHPGASGKSHQSLKTPKAAVCPGQTQHPHPCRPSWPSSRCHLRGGDSPCILSPLPPCPSPWGDLLRSLCSWESLKCKDKFWTRP